MLRIRHVEPEDADALAEMNRLVNCSSVTSQQMAVSLRRESGVEIILVAEDLGQLVGLACIQILRSALFPDPWAELTELYVDPEHRRRGIGSALLEQAEKWARARGATQMQVRTGDKNEAGRGIYQKRGYSIRPHQLLEKALKKQEK